MDLIFYVFHKKEHGEKRIQLGAELANLNNVSSSLKPFNIVVNYIHTLIQTFLQILHNFIEDLKNNNS